MTSAAGRVGPYVLGPELGRGASGVVYEASDERLGRKVALKTLDDEGRGSADLRARFAREARLLAAVRHPNVALVYDVVEEDGRVWLALEHVAGETLAEVVARGPLPLEEALDVARQVADGLEAAHEAGVVHRDLKPANLKRADDGAVKVLDFGLAKPVRAELEDSGELSSDGLALGTPLYMSPEQLRGRAVDRRADVWALGCVLWELLTGARPFAGETGADVVHAILEREPDEAALPRRTPARVRELLRRCLSKDPRARLRDVGDARLELEAALAERAWARPALEAAGAARGGRAARWALPVALALALLAAGWWLGRGAREDAAHAAEPLRLALAVPVGEKRTHPRLTPDGRTLLHESTTVAVPDERHLLARRLDAFADVAVPGTERVDTYCVAPDGERLALVRVAEGAAQIYELLLVRLDGAEPPLFLGRLPERLSDAGSVAWLDDGRVVLSTRPRALLLVATDGSGVMEEVPVRCDEDVWPNAPDILEALPGSREVLASSFHLGGRGAIDSVVAIDVETGRQRVVVEDSRCATLLPGGRLLYTRADVLFGLRCDPETMAPLGEPLPLASGLRTGSSWTSAMFQASRTGAVVWVPGGVVGAKRSLTWIGDGSSPEPWSTDELPLDGFLTVDASGLFLTVVVVGPSGNYELWGSEVERPRLRPLLAHQRRDYMGGLALPERRELLYCRLGPGGAELRRTSLDAPEEGELLYQEPGEGPLTSPLLVDEGRTLCVQHLASDRNRLLLFDADAPAPLVPRAVFEGTRETRGPYLSHDGRWLLSTERGAPSLRRVRDEGGFGPPQYVPTAGMDLVSANWADAPEDGGYRLSIMPTSVDRLFRLDVREGSGGLEFTAPVQVVRLEQAIFFDLERVPGGRQLGILVAPSERLVERVHLLIDGLGALEAR